MNKWWLSLMTHVCATRPQRVKSRRYLLSLVIWLFCQKSKLDCTDTRDFTSFQRLSCLFGHGWDLRFSRLRRLSHQVVEEFISYLYSVVYKTEMHCFILNVKHPCIWDSIELLWTSRGGAELVALIMLLWKTLLISSYCMFLGVVSGGG